MTCWEFLNINPTMDNSVIKRAYAKMLSIHHPEDNPNGFQKLREAFEEALRQAKFIDAESGSASVELLKVSAKERAEEKSGGQPSGSVVPAEDHSNTGDSPEDRVNRCMQMVTEVYSDFPRRRNVDRWRSIFDSQLMWPVDDKLMFGFNLFNFLGQYPWVPPAVWELAEEHFSWQYLQSDLYQHFPEEMVDSVLWRVRNFHWALGFDHIPLQQDVNYDAYLHQRECVQGAIRQGNYKAALDLISQASNIIEGDLELLLLSVTAFMHAGDFESAMETCEKLVRSYPDNLEGNLAYADLLLKRGRVMAALRGFIKALGICPDHNAGMIGMARCHMAIDNLFEAQKLLEEVREKCPDHVEAQMEMVRACHMQAEKLAPRLENNTAEREMIVGLAESYFQCGMYESANAILDAHLESTNDSDVHLLWARVLAALDRYEEAIRRFDQALRIAGQKGENPYHILMYRGIFQYNQNRFRPAIADLEKVRSVYAPNVQKEVWYHLADAYDCIHQYDTAIELFNELIACDSHEMKYFFHRGIAFFDHKQFTSALEDFKAALLLDYYCSARLWIGKCHVELGNYEQALEALQEAEDFHEDPDQIHYYRARCAFDQQNYETARLEIEQSIQIDPENEDFRYLAGYIYRALGNHQQALTHFSFSLDTGVMSIDNVECAANYFIEMRKYDDAVKFIESILEIKENGWSLLVITDLLTALGKSAKALPYVDRYFKAAAEFDWEIADIAYFLRGRARYLSHRRGAQEALADLHQAVELNACEMDCFYLSLAYFDIGDIANAKKYAQMAIDKKPFNDDFHRLLKGVLKFENFGWLRKKLTYNISDVIFNTQRIKLCLVGIFPKFEI